MHFARDGKDALMTDRRTTARPAILLAAAALSALPVAPAWAARLSNPVASFSGLDKITGRITTFDAYIGETVQFGALQVTPRACYSSDSAEAQKVDAFLEVDEITLDRKIKRIFNGWMFADSPALNAIEHPIFDVWLKECKAKSDVPPPANLKIPPNPPSAAPKAQAETAPAPAAAPAPVAAPAAATPPPAPANGNPPQPTTDPLTLDQQQQQIDPNAPPPEVAPVPGTVPAPEPVVPEALPSDPGTPSISTTDGNQQPQDLPPEPVPSTGQGQPLPGQTQGLESQPGLF